MIDQREEQLDYKSHSELIVGFDVDIRYWDVPFPEKELCWTNSVCKIVTYVYRHRSLENQAEAPIVNERIYIGEEDN